MDSGRLNLWTQGTLEPDSVDSVTVCCSKSKDICMNSEIANFPLIALSWTTIGSGQILAEPNLLTKWLVAH